MIKRLTFYKILSIMVLLVVMIGIVSLSIYALPGGDDIVSTRTKIQADIDILVIITTLVIGISKIFAIRRYFDRIARGQ